MTFGATRASADPDPTYTISGTITDASGAGVSGLGVSVYDSGNNNVGGDSTLSDGTYSIPGLAPGSYTLVTAGTNGYQSMSFAVSIVDQDVVVNAADPQYSYVSASVTAGSSPEAGVQIQVLDTVSGHQYSAAATDSNGATSITLPVTSDQYEFLFLNSVGTRLAVLSYSFGAGSHSLNSACGVNVDSGSQQALDAGGSIGLNVALNPDQTACNVATPAPTPAAAPTTKAKKSSGSRSSSLAITGTPGATATPTATPEATSSGSTTATLTPPKTTPTLIAPAPNTGPLPWWGWLFVALAVLLMAGGVGFTVVRHN